MKVIPAWQRDGWKFQETLVGGRFYSVCIDQDETRALGKMTAEDIEQTLFGLFKGQLLKVSGTMATFQFADEEMAWKLVIDMQTGESTGGCVITSIVEIDLKKGDAGGFKQKALEDAVERMIEKRVKGPAPVIEIKLDKGPNAPTVKVKERTHKSLAKLLYYISKGFHVYLWGPPGTGKTHAAFQVARVLKRTSATLSLNSQTPDSRLFGFINAVTGKYVPTEYYNCYTKGKSVYALDECDNAPGGLLTTLNGMHSSDKGAFPCGTRQMGKDYTLVATGNTCGRGADDLFPDRWSFDQAFSDRFVFIFWDYDQDLERDLALQINSAAALWVEWVFKVRAYCQENYPKLFVTPRVTYRGADILKDGVVTIEEMSEDILFKGFDRDSKDSILRAHPLPAVRKEIGKEVSNGKAKVQLVG